MEEVANIVIGADYFRKNARADYSNDLPTVWIREAIQNSLDAGAS
jgi:DNA topoisomerase VI subunit B